MTSKQKLQRVKLQQDRKTLAYERRYARLIRKALIDQVDNAISNRGVVDDLPMFNVLKGLYETVAFDFLQYQYRLLDSRLTVKAESFFLNTWRTWIQSYVFTDLAQHVSMINDTTRKKIQEAIAIGLDQGLEWDKIAKLLRDKVGDIASVYRSLMIARTETANAANMAKEKSKDDWKSETGETIYKLWIHRYAKEPRSWHQSLDNDIAIPENQDFEVYNPRSGRTEFMSRPHSSGASAENTVQCSCQAIYVSERFARQLSKDRGLPFTDIFQEDTAPTIAGPYYESNPSQYASVKDYKSAKDIIVNLVPKAKRAEMGSKMDKDKIPKVLAAIDYLSKNYTIGAYTVDTIKFSGGKRYHGMVSRWGTGNIRIIDLGVRSDTFTHRTNFTGTDVLKNLTRGKSAVDEVNNDISTVFHEWAHVIATRGSQSTVQQATGAEAKEFFIKLNDVRRDYYAELNENIKSDKESASRIYLGNYAGTNLDEFMAEAFTEYKLNKNPSKYAVRTGELIDEYFKKK